MKKIDIDDNLIPDDDFEYEKQLAQREHEKQDAFEKAKRENEEKRKQREKLERKERERKLNAEKVELMKLKSGVIEESETIKEEHEEVVQLHGKAKLANFWYHHKLIIIFGIFIAIVVSIIVTDTLKREKADLTVLMIADNGLSLRQKELEEFFEKYTDDLNGDGKVHVAVMIIPQKKGSIDQLYQSYSTKFMAQIQSGENVIVITDSNTDADYQAMFKSDLSEEFPDNKYIDEYGFSLNMKLLADDWKFEYMPNDVHLNLRVPVKTMHDSLDTMQENYDVQYEVFKRIVDDLTTRATESNDPGLTTEPINYDEQ